MLSGSTGPFSIIIILCTDTTKPAWRVDIIVSMVLLYDMVSIEDGGLSQA